MSYGTQRWISICLFIHLNVCTSIYPYIPPGQKPQSSLSRPYIYQMEPSISSLRHETSPPRPEISSLRSNISPHRPKISPFQTDIRLLRDAQVFCYLFPESMKIHLCSAGHWFFGYRPSLTPLPSNCNRAGHWVPLTIWYPWITCYVCLSVCLSDIENWVNPIVIWGIFVLL